MSFINKIFGQPSSKIECPRCLGKGYVTNDDIKRLRRELKWKAGSCAYCNGTGKVKADLPEKTPVDTTYLSTDIPAREAIKLQNGDKEALIRAKQLDIDLDNLIKEIEYFYFDDKMDINQIANYYFAKYPNAYVNEYAKKELIEFIQKVIAHSKK